MGREKWTQISRGIVGVWIQAVRHYTWVQVGPVVVIYWAGEFIERPKCTGEFHSFPFCVIFASAMNTLLCFSFEQLFGGLVLPFWILSFVFSSRNPPLVASDDQFAFCNLLPEWMWIFCSVAKTVRIECHCCKRQIRRCCLVGSFRPFSFVNNFQIIGQEPSHVCLLTVCYFLILCAFAPAFELDN